MRSVATFVASFVSIVMRELSRAQARQAVSIVPERKTGARDGPGHGGARRTSTWPAPPSRGESAAALSPRQQPAASLPLLPPRAARARFAVPFLCR